MRYRLLVLILGPFILWSVYFITLYGVQAVGCRANWDTTYLGGIPVLRLILVAILVAATILSVAMYVLAGRMPDSLAIRASSDSGTAEKGARETDQLALKRIGRYSAAAGLFATIIIFAGVLWLELC